MDKNIKISGYKIGRKLDISQISYLKTVVMLIFSCFIMILMYQIINLHPQISTVILKTIISFAIFYAIVLITAGIVVMRREKLQKLGIDLYLELNAIRSESVLNLDGPEIFGLRRKHHSLIRKVSGYKFLVGDIVEVKSFNEIAQTLDINGCLEGMPFMPEMLPYCGKKFRVFRCADKIYSFGVTRSLRHLRDAVLLTGLRCDGSEHDRCQARCYLMWKSAWLRFATNTECVTPKASDKDVEWLRKLSCVDKKDKRCYMCQYTQIIPATTPLRRWDIRQDFRPLIVGNVTFRTFIVTILVRIFNWAQTLRGGSNYPHLSPKGNGRTFIDLGLQPGEKVRVRDQSFIETTIYNDRNNLGLSFAHEEMTRYCNNTYTVLQRVNQIIDDVSGHMIHMKTPAIILKDVYSTGEFMRFLPQSDYPFWREVWLQRDNNN